MSDIETDNQYAPIACRNEDIFAARVDGDPITSTEPLLNEPCYAQSNGKTADITAENIDQIPYIPKDIPFDFGPNPLSGPWVQTSDLFPSNHTEPLTGIALKYGGGQICEDTGEPSTFTINMFCNSTFDYEQFEYGVLAYGDICNPQVDMISWAACPRLDINDFFVYLEQYDVYFGALFLIGGVLLVIWGRKFIRPAVFLAGFLSSLLLMALIFYAVYFDSLSQTKDFWFFVGGGVLLGIIVGLLLSCYVKIGAAVLAGWGGYALGMIFYEAVVFRAG